MRAIQFEHANINLAEGQEEYETLPIYACVDENNEPMRNADLSLFDPMGQMTCCLELNKEEIDEIVKTGQLWLTQCTFWNPFQPISMSTQNPFINQH